MNGNARLRGLRTLLRTRSKNTDARARGKVIMLWASLRPSPEVAGLIGISPSGVGNVLKRVRADR